MTVTARDHETHDVVQRKAQPPIRSLVGEGMVGLATWSSPTGCASMARWSVRVGGWRRAALGW